MLEEYRGMVNMHFALVCREIMGTRNTLRIPGHTFRLDTRTMREEGADWIQNFGFAQPVSGEANMLYIAMHGCWAILELEAMAGITPRSPGCRHLVPL
jgi:hypothetical protein